MGLKEKLKSNPKLKAISMWLLQPPNEYRPRWWIRNIVNPFVHKISHKAIIRRYTLIDIFPFKKFSVGENSIIEDFSLIANACGDVIIGKKVLIGCGSKITGPVTFGDNILLAQNVVISGLNHDFDDINTPIVHQGFSVKTIFIEDGAWIGAGAIITAGVRIGKNSVVGAGSVVTKNIPDYSVAVGNPAKVVKYFNHEKQEWITISTQPSSTSSDTFKKAND